MCNYYQERPIFHMNFYLGRKLKILWNFFKIIFLTYGIIYSLLIFNSTYSQAYFFSPASGLLTKCLLANHLRELSP